MKHTVRSFSVGLLTTGLIMLAVYYFIDDSNNDKSDISTDEMISHIEQEGYRVLTEKEYISYSVANTNQNNEEKNEEEQPEEEETTSAAEEEPASEETEEPAEEDADNETDEAETEAEEDENKPKTKTINIASGMASSQISSLLQDENLIDDAAAFNAYLQEHDYSLRVQLGQHELTEGMSFYEIAEELTN